eukprot:7378223-Prymnesium_polylepis.1
MPRGVLNIRLPIAIVDLRLMTRECSQRLRTSCWSVQMTDGMKSFGKMLRLPCPATKFMFHAMYASYHPLVNGKTIFLLSSTQGTVQTRGAERGAGDVSPKERDGHA